MIGPDESIPTLSTHDRDNKADTGASASSGAEAQPASCAADAATNRAADHVGPYRLVKKLGEGGMGQVWLAEQTTPVKRQVALKLIKAGMDSHDVVSRFESERQALAMMEHPAIARVYEAGVTADGRPYFVMEFVDGVPITSHCDTHRLTLRERLALFTKVCEGVQHAHQKAIIHRDLKPSNILVTSQDGKAVPKIIDFGLAKAVGHSLTDATLFTQVGTVVGTPTYMSPEQAGLQDIGLDTRTDVYSLGVIFYELLVGATPFDSRQPFDELLRRVREEDPPRPSTRIQKLDPDLRKLSAGNRSSQAAMLHRQLDGDLDWISLKALEKDPERRYSSPSEFAGDLQRYLNNEPVIARPPSTAYRCAKFVRRHRLAVGSAASVAALLVAFVVMMGVQAVRISRERDRAERNRAEATKQAQLALDTIYLVVTKADDQLRDIAGTGPLRKELLQGTMKNLDQISRDAATANWADRTMGVALQRMGDFYYQMGMNAEQVRVERRALTIFYRLMKEQPGEQWNPWNAAVSLDKLGGIARAEESNPSVAFDAFTESLKLREQLVLDVHQPQPPAFRRRIALGVSATKLADYCIELGDPVSALKYARQGLRAFTEAGNSGASTKEATKYLGFGYYVLGRAILPIEGEAKSRQALSRAVEIRDSRVQADPLDASAKLDLQAADVAVGDLELQTGNANAAFKQYERAVEALQTLLPKDRTNPEVQWNMANAQYGLGAALRTLGQEQNARSHFQECLRLRQVLLQAEPKGTQTRTDVMLAQAQLGQHHAATQLARELRDAAPHHPARLYSSAGAYALSVRALSQDRARTSPDQIQELQREYSDAAVGLLKEAVANGYRNSWMLEHDPEWESVRYERGFRELQNQISSRR